MNVLLKPSAASIPGSALSLVATNAAHLLAENRASPHPDRLARINRLNVLGLEFVFGREEVSTLFHQLSPNPLSSVLSRK